MLSCSVCVQPAGDFWHPGATGEAFKAVQVSTRDPLGTEGWGNLASFSGPPILLWWSNWVQDPVLAGDLGSPALPPFPMLHCILPSKTKPAEHEEMPELGGRGTCRPERPIPLPALLPGGCTQLAPLDGGWGWGCGGSLSGTYSPTHQPPSICDPVKSLLPFPVRMKPEGETQQYRQTFSLLSYT